MTPYVTKSADDTREFAAQIAAVARAGDIILLAGDLGAGKTTFAQGFARAIGVKGTVTSPTFTLVREYDGRELRLLHVDVYRLDRLQEVVDLGLGELVDDRAVALVEWGDVAEPVLPSDVLEIRMELSDAEDERVLRLRGAGAAWSARLPALASTLSRWREEAE